MKNAMKPMNDDKKNVCVSGVTEIVYVLDQSGSMGPMREGAIAAFNEFLGMQRAVPGEARFTLVLFDDRYEEAVGGVPIGEVPELTEESYVPRGSTALLDAIGRTIEALAVRIEGMAEGERPGKVAMAIFTDGMENASRVYGVGRIGELISEYRDRHGWEFLFLAANQDAIASAGMVSIGRDKGGNVEFSRKGMGSSMRAVSRKFRAIRLAGTAYMDSAAVSDEATALEDIIAEEFRKAGEGE
jgi:hypothetical protein